MSGDNWAAFTRLDDEIEDLTSEVTRLRAVIAEALEVYEHWNWNDFPTKSDNEQFIGVKRILAKATQTDKEGK